MRKAMILLGKIFFSATIAFTIMMIIFASISLAVGETRMDVMNVFQYLALCIAMSTLQMIAFTELIFPKLRYSLRMLLFALPFLVILTGFAVYDDIAKFAGAGTLVPITGFANAVVAPAIEFQTEGFVLGTAAKMFTIAGPVIVYGLSASVLYGVIYWICSVI